MKPDRCVHGVSLQKHCLNCLTPDGKRQKDNSVTFDLGTCQGCGAYGPVGRVHTRYGEECGEYL